MITIRPKTAADIADGMRLKGDAGWNQVEADWCRFLALGGDGCFVAEREARVVGSVTTCRFGPVGWVAMLLVATPHRGRGIGRSLLLRALEHLESRGVRSVRLDATPAGRPLYESLRFRVDFALDRFAGIVERAATGVGTRPGQPGDRVTTAALDRVATGTDRRGLIDRLIDDQPQNFRVAGPAGGPIRGFVLWRPGSSADQVGPCIADRDAGRALLDAAAGMIDGRTMIVDIPSGNGEAVAWAEGQGLRATRPLWRMTRGETVAEDPGRIWASSGPEMG